MDRIRGDSFPNVVSSRYVKFSWADPAHVPAIGQMDYVPKGGAFRMYREGNFSSEHTIAFPAQKKGATKASRMLRLLWSQPR